MNEARVQAIVPGCPVVCVTMHAAPCAESSALASVEVTKDEFCNRDRRRVTRAGKGG